MSAEYEAACEIRDELANFCDRLIDRSVQQSVMHVAGMIYAAAAPYYTSEHDVDATAMKCVVAARAILKAVDETED